jgi:RNA polymerase sigma factor (sigma-70 family)
MNMNDDATLSRIDCIETRWSLLQQNVHADEVMQRRMLVMRYRRAIESYTRAIVADPTEAADLAQDMFVRLLNGKFAHATPGKGRFRDMLKVAIRNLIRDHWRRGKVRKACRLDPSLLVDDPSCSESSEAGPWHESWRDSLLEMAFDAVAQYERKHPKSMAHTILRLRAEHPDATTEQMADILQQKTGRTVTLTTLRQRLRRARVMLADFLLEEIQRGLDHPTWDDVQAELESLGLLTSLKSYLSDESAALEPAATTRLVTSPMP